MDPSDSGQPPRRQPLTASFRKRREESRRLNEEELNEEEEEGHDVSGEGEDDSSNEGTSQSEHEGTSQSEHEEPVREESLPGPFPGGPEDTSILKSFATHVALSIWNNKERDPLKCVQHALKLDSWNFSKEPRRFKSKVKESGLFPLVSLGYKFTNRTLVSALVERWHPETNTFHLPFGEMTITLDDVKQILNIPIVGKAVTCTTLTYGKIVDLVVTALGIDEASVTKELSANRGHSLRMEWLRAHLSGVKDDYEEENVNYAVRGYLLYVLGCTLFSDKTGTKVPVIYLSCLMENIAEYAWGAAGLAYLYWQLGYASRSGVKQIAGYLTLLEAWSYEHFPIGRANPDLDYSRQQPRVARWKPRPITGNSSNNLRVFREAFDLLQPEAVIWDPYNDCRETHPFHEISFYTGCLRSFTIIEPYHPERVLRQFGLIQSIPPEPLRPSRASRGSTSQNYKVEYEFLDQYWIRWYNHVLARSERGDKVINPWDSVNGYLEWFHKITHQFVQNPIRRSGYDPRHFQISTTNKDWPLYRDKAVEMLDASIALGTQQDLQTILQREREVINLLRFEQHAPGGDAQQEGNTEAAEATELQEAAELGGTSAQGGRAEGRGASARGRGRAEGRGASARGRGRKKVVSTRSRGK